MTRAKSKRILALISLPLSIVVLVTSTNIYKNAPPVLEKPPIIESLVNTTMVEAPAGSLTLDEARWIVIEILKDEEDEYTPDLLYFEGMGSYEFKGMYRDELLETYDFFYSDEDSPGVKERARFTFQVHTKTGCVVSSSREISRDLPFIIGKNLDGENLSVESNPVFTVAFS